ncbi:sulfotransferase [Microcoleus sp. MON2_D5]|uniref:sulfotransferase n=1 Tax=Microcoleus sp. MON2_D5 TaxID=2818833 RepID=UPI002FD419A9
MKRNFLVGAPRSGTTILQSLLAAHPKITSFPETKFFHHLWTDRLSRKLPNRLREFFYKEICRPDLYSEVEVYRRQSTTDRINWFIGVLDKLAIEEGNSVWLEKTPEHIYFLESIADYLPQAKFIHIVRHPLDVVASMRKATQDPLNNVLWGGEWSLDFCVSRWNSSASISYSCANKSQHLVVKYEDLLRDKIWLLSQCCHFIDIAYDVEMLRNYRGESQRLSLGLPWHEGIDRAIEPAIIAKYKQFLSPNEIMYVLENTVELRQKFGYGCE